MLPQSYSTEPSRRTRRVPAPVSPSRHHSRSTALKDPSFRMTVRKTLGGASRIFAPTVMTLPLISNRPTSWTASNKPARVGCGPPVRERRPRGGLTDIPPAKPSRVTGGIEGHLGGLVVGDDLERGVPAETAPPAKRRRLRRRLRVPCQRVGADEGDVTKVG
jgi:hypothetical protein